MGAFDRLVAQALPIVPRGIVRRVAGRYIAGDRMEDAVALALGLAARGFASTIDQLGEDVVAFRQAEEAADGYVRLIGAMSVAGAPRNVSIKLSQIGLRLDPARSFGELERVLEAAAGADFFVRIDMEDAQVTDATLEAYERARAIWPRVGVVLQARLRRTGGDIRALAGGGANVRLCKGIYPETKAIALTDREEIRAAYVDHLRALLEGGAYVGIATHDPPLIAAGEALVAEAPDRATRHEFQALLGVPMRTELERLRDAGHAVRLYVPFGPDWYAYSLRRVRENPSMAGAIARGIFRGDRLT